MMSGTERIFATPAGIKLGPIDAIAEGAARNYVIQLRAGRFHGFVVRRSGMVFGYVDRCPHMGVPLAKTLDDYLTPDGDLIACGWHSALFTIEDGQCVGGPCMGARLERWPVRAVKGVLVTGDEPPSVWTRLRRRDPNPGRKA